MGQSEEFVLFFPSNSAEASRSFQSVFNRVSNTPESVREPMRARPKNSVARQKVLKAGKVGRVNSFLPLAMDVSSLCNLPSLTDRSLTDINPLTDRPVLDLTEPKRTLVDLYVDDEPICFLDESEEEDADPPAKEARPSGPPTKTTPVKETAKETATEKKKEKKEKKASKEDEDKKKKRKEREDEKKRKRAEEVARYNDLEKENAEMSKRIDMLMTDLEKEQQRVEELSVRLSEAEQAKTNMKIVVEGLQREAERSWQTEKERADKFENKVKEQMSLVQAMQAMLPDEPVRRSSRLKRPTEKAAESNKRQRK